MGRGGRDLEEHWLGGESGGWPKHAEWVGGDPVDSMFTSKENLHVRSDGTERAYTERRALLPTTNLGNTVRPSTNLELRKLLLNGLLRAASPYFFGQSF